MKLFSPITINGMTLKNRIVMSPMCMYSCADQSGKVQDWHKVHYPARAVGQVGLIIVEASAVTEQGRISPQDLGIWSDEHVAGLKELVGLVQGQGSKIAIQLAHAGRKAVLDSPIIAPSAIPFNDSSKTPEAMSLEQVKATQQSFIQAARRAQEAGFDAMELHGAHGYLINEFLSPLANHRTDIYGGDRDNRYRFLGEIIDGIRAFWKGPLFVRISANEYHPEGNQIDDFIYFAEQMKAQGIDLIDCSSGSVVPTRIDAYPGYQVPLAHAIKTSTGIATGAVGLITAPEQAEEIISNGRADLILLGRELLRDPYWPRTAAKQLGAELAAPKQYQRGW
ncbi:NADPH dehydrogenase NamA [Paenibacillus radicis (ex Xue et al. 2023)]|uniref:NADPH dehydrogenase NamA n=1 Tax=Paenibacillus radicis (ex Xue et al. 2023) TaxID=2972489 RepID=A0ABT1YUH1_9BACL|nr:NADPH dehydrogenase NamA [Paenibacillus radicis (ex Xue et al. 2023)]MCR8635835.1 NADPH dehydrogenase NamA [Paenibacillus radicis (ex Xue et al. 2023)]